MRSIRADAKGAVETRWVETVASIAANMQTLVDTGLARNVVCARQVKQLIDEMANATLDESGSITFALALAKYALSTRSMDEDARCFAHESVTSLLVSVKDKDVFLEALHVLLARYLLTRDALLSLDSERQLIAKIKRTLGAFSVLKMEDMLSDFDQSVVDLGSTVKGRVLKLSSWPSLFKDIKVSDEIRAPCESFVASLTSQAAHRLRKLEPVWLAGRVTLEWSMNGKVYDVCMSPVQASVVLLVAKRATSFDSLSEALRLPVKTLVETVVPML